METDSTEEENKETKEEVKPVKTEKDLVRLIVFFMYMNQR